VAAVKAHDSANHYRAGEVERVVAHRAVIEQPSDDRDQEPSAKARLLVPVSTAVRVNLLRGFDPPPRLSLCRLLLRLKLGLRSGADENPVF
jgi:hypothetical protein